MGTLMERELLSAVKDLTSHEMQWVIDYAKVLHSTPISQVGQAYLEVLAQKGVLPTELLRTAQAVQRVEGYLTQLTPQAALYDLERRTDDQMQTWFRERGPDYEAITEQGTGVVQWDRPQRFPKQPARREIVSQKALFAGEIALKTSAV